MSSNKRSATDDPDIDIERLARQKLAELRRSNDPSLKRLPCMKWPAHFPVVREKWDGYDDSWPEKMEPMGLDEASSQVRQHHDLLAFMAGNRDSSYRRTPHVDEQASSAHRVVQWARNEIVHEMTSALTRVDELYRLIQAQNLSILPLVTEDRPTEQVSGDASDINSRAAWYWKGDLLALDVQYIDAMLGLRSIENAEDFRQYIYYAVRTGYVAGKARLSRGTSQELIDKTLALYEALDYCTAPDTKQQALILCVDLIVWLAEQNDSDVLAPARKELASLLLEFAQSQCRHISPQDSCDFPAMRRRLWAHWNGTFDCPLDLQSDGHRAECPCFHEGLVEMLSMLQRAAFRDIRTNTYIAVEAHLPPELADLVVEAVCLSEDIPAQPDIYDNTAELRAEYRCAWVSRHDRVANRRLRDISSRQPSADSN